MWVVALVSVLGQSVVVIKMEIIMVLIKMGIMLEMILRRELVIALFFDILFNNIFYII